jgi:hypothetical protein
MSTDSTTYARQGTIKVQIVRAAGMHFSPSQPQLRCFCTVALEHRIHVEADGEQLRQLGLGDEQIKQLARQDSFHGKRLVGGATGTQSTDLNRATPLKTGGQGIEFYKDLELPIWEGWHRGLIVVKITSRAHNNKVAASGKKVLHTDIKIGQVEVPCSGLRSCR